MSKNKFVFTRRKFLQLACGTAAGSLLWGCQDKQSVSQDNKGSGLTIFHNGTVLPVDANFSEYQAFAFHENKIVAVGSNESIMALAGKNAKQIDLQGRTVLPGFIEPHIHFTLLSLTADWLDIGPLKYETTDQALSALSKFAGEGGSDEWILARQFDPSLQTGPAMLTTRELDQISSTRPIFILNASGHLAYMNSVLLQLAGINKDTPNPPGAEYFRFDDGAPNGAKTQKAYIPILLSNEKVKQSFMQGSVESGIKVGNEAASLGITTLCDMATGGASGYAEF